MKLTLLTLLMSAMLSCTSSDEPIEANKNQEPEIEVVENSLATYPGVADLESQYYKVTLIQDGESQESFVYQDANKFTDNKRLLCNNNHWTNFSFEGEVTVEVEPLNGVAGNYEVRPIDKGIKCTVTDQKISFTIDKPSQLYLWSDSELDEPLFIFANPLEERIDINDPNVVYWGPGVHEIGKHYPILSNKIYYLDGGAYLKGSFLSQDNVSNVRICGRGILSGELIEHASYKEAKFDRAALILKGQNQKNLFVEGITFINPGQYCMQAYGSELHTSNVKCFGWWYETDGWVGGHKSILKDSFFKVNDDIVKIYFDDIRVNDITVFKQNNGAIVQYGWSSECSRNAIIDGIDVVRDEAAANADDTATNRGLTNTGNGNPQNTVSNILIQNVRYDGDLSYIIGIRSQGTYNGITIKDMVVRGEQTGINYLQAGNPYTGNPEDLSGEINGITFDNIVVNGVHLTSDDDIKLMVRGENIEPIIYK